MLRTFGNIQPYFKIDHKAVSIDNLAFKLHYRWSFIILVACTVLITSRQYIGEHIRCITGGSIPDHVINSFCFFTTTFTLVRHFNESALSAGQIAHAGIGPRLFAENPIKRHAYYQWVPFVLFAQALAFSLPQLLWKSWEGGRIQALVYGLKLVSLSKYVKVTGTPLNLRNLQIPTADELDGRVKIIGKDFKSRLKVNNYWGRALIFCEIANLINICLQIYLTNIFLGGYFYSLGREVMKDNWSGPMDYLDVVFPKVTKCEFHKFGPSGTIQKHDALCIMALNVMNEKIYTFLWFWFGFLLVTTTLAVLWRLFTIFVHARSSSFNANVFSFASPGRLNRHDVDVVTKKCSFSDWMFLYHLASNMDANLFRQVLAQLALELCEDENCSSGDCDHDSAEEIEENEANHRSESRKTSHAGYMAVDTVDGPRSTADDIVVSFVSEKNNE